MEKTCTISVSECEQVILPQTDAISARIEKHTDCDGSIVFRMVVYSAPKEDLEKKLLGYTAQWPNDMELSDKTVVNLLADMVTYAKT